MWSALPLSKRAFHSQYLGVVLFASIALLVAGKSYSPLFVDMKRTFLRRRRSVQDDAGELISSPTRDDRSWRSKYSQDVEGMGQCVLEIINELNEVLIVCWIDFDGNLKNYYNINDRSIRDGSVQNRHMEYTYPHHSFICLRKSKGTRPRHLRDVKHEDIIFHYTPTVGNGRHRMTVGLRAPSLLSRHRTPTITVSLEFEPKDEDDEVIATSDKVYEPLFINGFKLFCEPGVFDVTPGLEEGLCADIAMLTKLLPPSAKSLLQDGTSIYLNTTLRYGTKKRPVDGTSMCYHEHDGQPWLLANGLSPLKAGCVEIANAAEYLRTRGHWGVGGVLIHEFCHAFHNKHCLDRFENADIVNAYNTAMSAGLYDSVVVHGPQGNDGKKPKAYACTNAMEFFAELSVAYLYNIDNQEYNKWYPHNRTQLMEHDPATYEVLNRIWNGHDGSGSQSEHK